MNERYYPWPVRFFEEGGRRGRGGGTRGLRGEVARKDVVDSLMVVCEWHRTYVDHIMPRSKAFKLDTSPDSFIY